MTTTLKEAALKIGKKAVIRNGPLSINVTILDFKNSYGKDRWQVEPVAGSGTAWVEDLEIIEDEA